MNTEDMSVIESPAAKQIEAFCWNLGHQLNLPLESVYWAQDIDVPRYPNKHLLAIKVTFLTHPENIALSHEEILCYPTGQSTAVVEDKIREKFEYLLTQASC